MLLHLLRRQHAPAQCKHFQSAVGRINNLPHKPLILLPYLFGKQLCPSGASCPHCHAFLLYTLLRTKVTPTKMGVVTEIHNSTNSCVVVWKVPRFRQLTQPTYSFDFRTPQNRVLHMRIDPLVRSRGWCSCCLTHAAQFGVPGLVRQRDTALGKLAVSCAHDCSTGEDFPRMTPRR